MKTRTILTLIAGGLTALSGFAQSPTPSPSSITHNLLNVNIVTPALLQEVRYATNYNFTGSTLYPSPSVFVHKDLLVPLQKIQMELSLEGLGLKIYDGYRPLSVQQKMWDLIRDERYVSDPSKSKGKHTRGTALDVTLVDKMGNELRMPTKYDDFTDKAHRSAKNWSPEEKANSLKLEAVMTKYGFIPFAYEWWHFDYSGWEKYPPLNVSYEDLAKGVLTATPAP